MPACEQKQSVNSHEYQFRRSITLTNSLKDCDSAILCHRNFKHMNNFGQIVTRVQGGS
jgi:hypothetical protein